MTAPRLHVVRSTKKMGLNRLGEELHPIIPGLRAVPRSCPHCANPCLRHQTGSPEVNCPLCGWEALMEPPMTAHGPAWR